MQVNNEEKKMSEEEILNNLSKIEFPKCAKEALKYLGE